jgi:rhodanese-related sulfurtransferase
MHSAQPNLKIIDLRDEVDADSLGFDCIKIPYYEISQNIHLLTDCDTLVFYCKYGIKSMNVINYLKKYHNMENLYSLVI